MVLHLLNKKLRYEAMAFWVLPMASGEKKRGVKKDHAHTHTHTYTHSQKINKNPIRTNNRIW